MAIAAMRPLSTLLRRLWIAVCAVAHQSSASCSNHPAFGFDRAMAVRPSARARPSRSQAMAFVAVVEESRPITRSRVMYSLREKERQRRGEARLRQFQGALEEAGVFDSLVDEAGDIIHALLGVAA